MEIRDTRNGDWHWVSNIVLACESITHADKAVYSALATFSGYQELRPTFEMIAKRCNVGIRTAKRSIVDLEKAGFVAITNHGKKGVANVYILNKTVGGCVKKCQICTSEVPPRHYSSAKLAPHIDRHIDNKYDESDDSLDLTVSYEEDEPRSKKLTKEIKQVFALFSKTKKGWMMHMAQREAAERQWKERGMKQLTAAMDFYNEHKEDKYCPVIRTPFELEEKWSKLHAHQKRV